MSDFSIENNIFEWLMKCDETNEQNEIEATNPQSTNVASNSNSSSLSSGTNVTSLDDHNKLQKGIVELLDTNATQKNTVTANTLKEKNEERTVDHIFQKNETVLYISKDGKSKTEAKIVAVHKDDPEYVNYTIKIGERELNTLPNNLSPITCSNTIPSSSSPSSSLNPNVVDLQIYEYSGKDEKFNFQGNADFDKVNKDVSDCLNVDDHDCHFGNEFSNSEFDYESQNEDGDGDEDEGDTKSVLSNISGSSCTSYYSNISIGSCTSNYSTKSAKSRYKRSSDEELKIFASSAQFVEVISDCKCSNGSCAQYLYVKQVL